MMFYLYVVLYHEMLHGNKNKLLKLICNDFCQE